MIKITEDLYYLGDSSYTENLFERMFEIPNGMSYNSYLLVDEDKTILFDTVDNSIIDKFLSHLKEALNGRNLDILIIQHMELDHAQAISNILSIYPDVKIYTSNIASNMIINNLHNPEIKKQIVNLTPNLKLMTKNHTFSFINAAFIHWPEVYFTYDETKKILFSADAFGNFGANGGILFSSQVKKDDLYYSEMRRYYSNIVGKYGSYVNRVLDLASKLEIKLICPLHGQIIDDNFDKYLDLYSKWAKYLPEVDSEVSIFVGSMYSNTLSCCIKIQQELTKLGVKCNLFDISNYEVSYLVSEAFRVKHIILASPTYNSNIFPLMENFLTHLVNLNLQNRNFYLVESGSWAVTSGNCMQKLLSNLKNSTISPTRLSFLGSFDYQTKKEDFNKFIESILTNIKND